MTATSPMQRLCLAALLWLVALVVASPGCAAAVEVIGQDEKAEAGTAAVGQATTTATATARDPISIVPGPLYVFPGDVSLRPSNELQWWARPSSFSALSAAMANRARLWGIGKSCARWKVSSLAPALVAGSEFPMPSMSGMQRRNTWDSFALGWAPPASATNPWFPQPEPCDEEWITVADLKLPCLATDYDRTFLELSAIYALWKDDSLSRLAKSLQDDDDPGFFTIIEWELARAGK